MKNAHLSITSTDAGAHIQAKGDAEGLIFVWVLLTTHIAKKLKIPLAGMLTLCAALSNDVEALNRSADTYEIDLSRPHKGATP